MAVCLEHTCDEHQQRDKDEARLSDGIWEQSCSTNTART